MLIKNKILRENVNSYLFLLPFLIIFLVFLAYPVIYSFVLSLHRVTPSTDLYNVFSDMKFVFFKNYVELFKDSHFWWSLIVTFYYAILTIPAMIFCGLLLAIFLNNKLPGVSLFRSAYFLPNVLDILVIGIIWTFIYSPHFGIFTRVMEFLGIKTFTAKGILGNPRLALPGIALAMVLKGMGFGMILFLAAIQNIPKSVYEAADIDGASQWQKLIYVTIPLVKPVIFFLAVIGTISALNAFTEIYAMTAGGPYEINFLGEIQGATKLSGYYLFEKWSEMKYGYAASISYVLLIITLIISLINAKLLRRKT